jgi:2-aminoadipate transaminase
MSKRSDDSYAPDVTTPVPLARRTQHVRSSAIRDLLSVTQRPEVISLAGGLPAPDSFPVEELRALTDRLMRDDPQSLLQYSTTEGYEPLRQWIAARASGDRARPVDPSEVLVTHGSQQALDLVAKAMVDPGTVVAIDEPGYVGAIQALSAFEPEFLPIPVDQGGLMVDVLAERLAAGARPRLLYTVINFQNPTGATLTESRRAQLAALAEQYGFLIVEDDPYGALRFAGDHLPSIAQWAEHVVSLGTFSKLVVPGLRVGWMVAPPWLLPHLVRLKQGADLHTSSWGQVLLHGQLTQHGWLGDHAKALVHIYGSRADALADALVTHVGDRIEFQRPDGGMFLWARLAGGVDARQLFDAALRHDVAFVPGDAFYTGPPDPATLRLSYATASPARLDEGARRLAAALDELGAST